VRPEVVRPEVVQPVGVQPVGVQPVVVQPVGVQPVEAQPVVVQPMAPPGVSTVVRLVTDPAVGPLISLRLGGPAADLLADPLTRTLPLTDLDAADLVAGIRGASLLDGADVLALRDVLLRVARLAEELPELAEVRLDPVLVGARGVVVLHGGVRLLPAEADPERGPRQLTGRGGAAHLRGRA
jgi:acetyltransferase